MTSLKVYTGLVDRPHNSVESYRRSIRLKGYDYSQPGAYFITVCTHNRKPVLGRIMDAKMELSDYGRIVSARWLNLPRHYSHLELNAFVVMPNHIHGILMFRSTELAKRHPVSEIVRSFKTFSSRRINEIRDIPGIPVWQRNYWEHVIRDQESFKRIHDYILTNPLRWHLDKENPQCVGEDDFDHWLDGL